MNIFPYITVMWTSPFLNQARRPARAWFLRIASVRECLYECVCPPPGLLITSGVIYNWLTKFYMAAVVGIGSGREVSIIIYV